MINYSKKARIKSCKKANQAQSRDINSPLNTSKKESGLGLNITTGLVTMLPQEAEEHAHLECIPKEYRVKCVEKENQNDTTATETQPITNQVISSLPVVNATCKAMGDMKSSRNSQELTSLKPWPPAGVKWYYSDSHTCIAHGDCREILPTLLLEKVKKKEICIISDPPYGIGWDVDYAKSREASIRRKVSNGTADKCWREGKHTPIYGDNKPFEPAWLLALQVPMILWGANHYADKLPSSPQWLIWDKKTERGAKNGFGDCEMAWVRGGDSSAVRIFRHMWCGYQRDSEISEGSLHPTQKPVALMQWCLTFFPQVKNVADPYMGTGPVLIACKLAGIKCVGIEIVERYAEIAASRLRQSVLNFEG